MREFMVLASGIVVDVAVVGQSARRYVLVSNAYCFACGVEERWGLKQI